MAKSKNYLLGRAERLVRKLEPPPIKPNKNHPYTFATAIKRVVPKFEAAASELRVLPREACPHDEAVAMITLHPAYLAKSYFPDALLDEANLWPVGSRMRTVSPDAWAIKDPPSEATAAELFVAGKRDDFAKLPRLLSKWTEESRGSKDIVKIEDIRSYPVSERVRAAKSELDAPYWEVILHATNLPGSDYILEGFRDYLADLEIMVDLDERLHAQGLCFLPVRIPKRQIEEVAKFAFLRAARVMPRMRPVVRMSKSSPTFPIELPDKDAVDPTIRVAVFDGGLPSTPNLSRWSNRRKANGIGAAAPDLVEHGLGVTSALLFGPLEDDTPLPQPYANVDHFRVLDENTEDEDSTEYFNVIKRIMPILESGNYEFANFSIGPELEVEDDNVHLWTAMLDQFLKKGQTLAGIAGGNTGEKDHDSGSRLR